MKFSRKSRKEPIKINLLMLRKGEKSLCEICENIGTLLCSNCRVTYYCSMSHLQTDLQLHNHLCSVLKTLRTPIPFSSSPETRDRMKKQYELRMKEIYRFTYLKGMVAMVEGQYEFAIASSSASCRTAVEIFGESSELILPKTVLTQCYIKINRIKDAKQTLTDCLRLEMALGDISPQIRAMIRRIEGLLSIHQEKYVNARYYFAEEIFLISGDWGPDHIRTAFGYSNLGETFKKQDFVIARSLIKKAVDIWSRDFGRKVYDITDSTFPKQQSRQEGNAGPRITTIYVPSVGSHFVIKEISVPDSILLSCERQEGLNNLNYCYDLLVTMNECVLPIDFVEIELARAQILYADENIYKAKSTIVTALQKCEQFSLHGTNIHKQLLKLQKDCDKRLLLIKRHVEHSVHR